MSKADNQSINRREIKLRPEAEKYFNKEELDKLVNSPHELDHKVERFIENVRELFGEEVLTYEQS